MAEFESGATEGNTAFVRIGQCGATKHYPEDPSSTYFCLEESGHLNDHQFAEPSKVAGWLPELAASLKPEPTGAQGRADKAAVLELLAEVGHLWVDGYIAKNPNSEADDSISGSIFDRVFALLEASGITVDYCGWQYSDAVSLTPSEPVSPQPEYREFRRCIFEDNGFRCQRAEGHEGKHRLSESPLPVQEPQGFRAWVESAKKFGLRFIDGGETFIASDCSGPVVKNIAMTLELAAPELPVRPQEEFEKWWAWNAAASFNNFGSNSGMNQAFCHNAWNAGRAALLKPSNPAPTSESNGGNK